MLRSPWLADLIDDNSDIIIEPLRRKLLFLRDQDNCLLNCLVGAPIIRCDDHINILSGLTIAQLGDHQRTTKKNHGRFDLHICKLLAQKAEILFDLCAVHTLSSLLPPCYLRS